MTGIINKDLAAKIKDAELSGIFNWVLEGLRRLNGQGNFTESKAVAEALTEFRQESDSVYQFIFEERYEKSATHRIDFMPFYKRYQQFCIDNGFRPLNIRNFRKRLETQNISVQRRASGNVVFVTHHVETQTTIRLEEWVEDSVPPF